MRHGQSTMELLIDALFKSLVPRWPSYELAAGWTSFRGSAGLLGATDGEQYCLASATDEVSKLQRGCGLI
ncbi:hypothetical protein ES319_A03G110100v1 [Gossypium barbadense]|uniref:Uncharacterized protein n=1 Tax=Gossypium barbadense TaxID=3634 RepID=A0A5J5WD89_GOSBA|nr:hypothetical protein ES319_A03G110100v1 [Gossypium barbadense]